MNKQAFKVSDLPTKWDTYHKEALRLTIYERLLRDWPALIESIRHDVEWMRMQIPDEFVQSMIDRRLKRRHEKIDELAALKQASRASKTTATTSRAL